MTVVRMPKMFSRKEIPNVATNDPRIAAIIMVQAALATFAEEEQEFIIKTVIANLELHRKHSRAYELED